tara:strand:+ start:426 stop:611 length:186 start_codon:yes stop_codon:yes gene_type:complete
MEGNMYYINFKYGNLDTETIDEYTTRKEAREMLTEYTYGGGQPNCKYWISRRSTKEWREEV